METQEEKATERGRCRQLERESSESGPSADGLSSKTKMNFLVRIWNVSSPSLFTKSFIHTSMQLVLRHWSSVPPLSLSLHLFSYADNEMDKRKKTKQNTLLLFGTSCWGSCMCEECSIAVLTLTLIKENTVNKLYI